MRMPGFTAEISIEKRDSNKQLVCTAATIGSMQKDVDGVRPAQNCSCGGYCDPEYGYGIACYCW
jgi:hypothetical protein